MMEEVWILIIFVILGTFISCILYVSSQKEQQVDDACFPLKPIHYKIYEINGEKFTYCVTEEGAVRKIIK